VTGRNFDKITDADASSTTLRLTVNTHDTRTDRNLASTNRKITRCTANHSLLV